ncbi:hypothetical protein TRAPUB_9234 [Trametes pubescens]|uniref:COX assembly mitochondrial protein n=1 Tax=Trametes pubescens TaxID=154538 RepID=A0A1M2W2U4_TRAPU|nr:hypothetical protein TRAPUB_9234 [Trametes pubescens]
MHPQLTEKKLGSHPPPAVFCNAHTRHNSVALTHRVLIVCLDFIQALDACHANGWSRWTGACNQAKHDLNMCLRKERIDRTTKNREDAKSRRVKTEQAWKDLHVDE